MRGRNLAMYANYSDLLGRQKETMAQANVNIIALEKLYFFLFI